MDSKGVTSMDDFTYLATYQPTYCTCGRGFLTKGSASRVTKAPRNLVWRGRSIEADPPLLLLLLLILVSLGILLSLVRLPQPVLLLLPTDLLLLVGEEGREGGAQDDD